MKRIFRFIFDVVTFTSKCMIGGLAYIMIISASIAPLFAVGTLTYHFFNTLPAAFCVYFSVCFAFLVFVLSVLRKSNSIKRTYVVDLLFTTWVTTLWPVFLITFIATDLLPVVNGHFKTFINWVYKD